MSKAVGITPMGGRDHAGMQVRDLRFGRGQVLARHWVGGDPFATALFNSLSVIFPRGEAFFIEALREWRDEVGEELRPAIDAFIAQELGHSREHLVLNRGIREAGYDTARIERGVGSMVERLRRRGRHAKLTATMCLEHLTAVVGVELIREPRHLADADPEQRRLWLWHAIEEVEHRAVAFDVWMAANRDRSRFARWARRSGAMLLVATAFVARRVTGSVHLLAQDSISGAPAWLGASETVLGRGSLGLSVLRSLLQFMRPGFHPSQLADAALLAAGEALLAGSPAAEPRPMGEPRTLSVAA